MVVAGDKIVRMDIPGELHRWMKIQAAEEGSCMKEVLIRALKAERQRIEAEKKQK